MRFSLTRLFGLWFQKLFLEGWRECSKEVSEWLFGVMIVRDTESEKEKEGEWPGIGRAQ
jgi:hypothetical protein